jgi:hypothetical protein
MNALTCTTWFILTIIPLTLSAFVLLTRNQAWTDRKFWLRAAVTLFLASLLLLPFLLPLRRVAATHGFTRTAEEVKGYSARWINWLAPDERSRAWRGFAKAGVINELVLFPGLMAPLLGISALLLTTRKTQQEGDEETDLGPDARAIVSSAKRIAVGLLDATAIIAGIIGFLALGYDQLRLKLFGHLLLVATGPERALTILGLAILVRCLIAYPRILRNALNGEKNLAATFSSPQRSELFGHAVIWILIGFAGSFGLNFFFHKFLYDNVTLFRGMRVATRWAMVSYVGLALLAGLGAQRIAARVDGWWRWRKGFGKPLVYGLIVVAILLDLRVAPLRMIRGEADPDALTLELQARKMNGGILELPIGDRDHMYMLRAADHGHPIINGRYSFVPALQRDIEQLVANLPISERLLDVLETVPVSYVTVHHSMLSPEEDAGITNFLQHGVATGRLRFIKSFEEDTGARNDLYVVTKTEPTVEK